MMGAVTPKTPMVSPPAAGAGRFSPSAVISVSFGDLDTATPKTLEAMAASSWSFAGGASSSRLLRQAKAAAAAQQELASAARPHAEAARRHFLARESSWSADGAGAAPVLLGRRHATVPDVLCIETLPTFLGRPAIPASVRPPPEREAAFEFDAVAAARRSRDAFL